MMPLFSTRTRHLLCAWVALAVIHAQLKAQGAPPGSPAPNPDVEESVKNEGGNLDAYYAIPEIPATSILAGAPLTITRPVTPKDFATALINGVDQDGKVRQSFALEVSVGLFRLLETSLAEYQSSWYNRGRPNTLLSIATSPSSG